MTRVHETGKDKIILFQETLLDDSVFNWNLNVHLSELRKAYKDWKLLFTRTYIRNLLCWHIVLTIWFKGSTFFPIFLLVTFSCDFYIVHFLRCCGMNACDLPVLLIELTLRGFVMIGSLEFHGWCTCPDHGMAKYKNYRR